MTSPVGKGVPAWIAPIAAIAGPSASSRAASGPPAIVGFGPRTASSQAPRVKVNGLEDAIARGRSVPSTQAQVGRAPLASSSWGSARGYIQSKITATDAGWEIEVETHHAERGDDVSLFVSVRVTDPPVEHWVPLAMPFAGVMDGASGSDKHGLFVTTKKFFVALADVNAFFAKHGADKLVFRPGDPLSIDAYWQGAGHQSGGRRDASQGWLATPPLVAVGSPLDVRSAAVPIARPAAPVLTGRASDKPVDLAIALPDALVQKYPAVFPKGAKLVSRREAEMKLEPKTFDELKDFTLRLDALSRLPAGEQERALAAIFGEDGWSLARTER